MGQQQNLILSGTEAFSRGSLENMALEKGAIILDSIAGRYLQYGSYTTPEFVMPAFSDLNVSWNADVPKESVIELKCRIYAGGRWTEWMSFGKWAADYPRRSNRTQTLDGQVFLHGDTVTVTTPGGATGIQLQIVLSSNNDKVTPTVWLLAMAVRPLNWNRQVGTSLNRNLYLPEYCLNRRDPSFGKSMDLPLILASLMNRLGEDVLPEEIAYIAEDYAAGSTRNAAYGAAAVGSCGYRCWQAYVDTKDLRREIREGFPAAVEMKNLTDTQGEKPTVWMGLHGFEHDSKIGADFALLNDPTQADDVTVARTMAVADFRTCFTGRAILLRPKDRDKEKGEDKGKVERFRYKRPCRILCEMKRMRDGFSYRFERGGKPDFLPDDFSGWIACTLWDGVAHATTAHKIFHRMERTPEGTVRFPQEILAVGGRCTVYAVDSAGRMRVAEVHLPKPAPQPQPKEEFSPLK